MKTRDAHSSFLRKSILLGQLKIKNTALLLFSPNPSATDSQLFRRFRFTTPVNDRLFSPTIWEFAPCPPNFYGRGNLADVLELKTIETNSEECEFSQIRICFYWT